MATRALVSVEEYLSTVYEPDVEGELIERNMGEPVEDGFLRREDPRIEILLAELFDEE